MRATYRCSRALGSAKHNDRSFDLTKASHIDERRTVNNLNWHCFEKAAPEMTFSQAEEYFYRKRYSASLNATNERYIANRHPERCRTSEDLLNSPKTRPEEVILQIGNKDSYPDPAVLKKAMRAYLTELGIWNKEHGSHLHMLNYSIHLDETTPHVHIRQCWDYIDKDGNPRLGQEKALEQAGIELPDASKPAGQYNNRKMTFDAMMREKWYQLLKRHGIELETEPLSSKKHQDREAFIDSQITKKLETIEKLDKQIEWTKKLREKQQEFQRQ